MSQGQGTAHPRSHARANWSGCLGVRPPYNSRGETTGRVSGQVLEVELDVAAHTLRKLFGREIEDAVKWLRSPPPIPAVPPVDELRRTLTPLQKETLVGQLAAIASADSTVTDDERSLVLTVARELEVPASVVEDLFGPPQNSGVERSPAPPQSRTCGTCGKALPPSAAFCPACGARAPVHCAGDRACPSCDFRVGPDAAFCSSCGTKV
jgi:RNA polymerase subunit RPABC4/transcription elongation factor Spt4